MTKTTLQCRIDALENEIWGADAQTQQEMIARLRRLVLTLDIGRPTSFAQVRRRSEGRQEDLFEDAFDNLPI